MAAQVIEGLTDAEYSELEGIRCTTGKLYAQHPPAKARELDQREFAVTPALLLGRLVHAHVLTPQLVSSEFTFAPRVDRRTKAGKEIWAAFEESSAGKEVVKQEVWDQAVGMHQAVLNHSHLRDVIYASKRELSIQFADRQFHRKLKAKLDLWAPDNCVWDLKTTSDGSPEGFQKAAMKYGYDLQAWWYLEAARAAGLDPAGFKFLCVETEPPHLVSVYKAGESLLQRGKGLYHRVLHTMTSCEEMGYWPGYSEEEVLLEAPAWALESF